MGARFASLAASAVLALGASTAFAQQATDYVISKPAVGSMFEAPPATGVTTLTLSSGVADDGYAVVSLPFTFNYFHANYTSIAVCTNGFLKFGTPSAEWRNTGFPIPTSAYDSASFNGAVCAYWSDLVTGPQYPTVATSTNNGSMKTWITGAAPNRHFVVMWDSNYDYGTNGADGAGPMKFQIQLFELGGSIVISYGSAANTFPTTGTSPGYTVGIQGGNGAYQYPDNWTNDGTSSTGRPATDYQFDYPPLTFTGRLVYDRYIVDESGIGNTSQQNVPLAGFVVEARDGSNAVVGTSTTDATGAFSLVSHGVPVSTVGTIAVTSKTTACVVHGSVGAPPYSTVVASAVSYSGDRNFGTILLHEGVDAGGVGRAPLNIARTIQTVYDWAASRTSATIPFLDVLYSTASALPTTYAPASTTPASMRVGGATSNPDQWDASVIRKTYARHVINAITAPPSTPYDQGFDVSSDEQNAFAEGFGYYMNAVVSGDRKYYDGINSTTTNVIDLEDASPTSAKGPTVAAWVAEALYDLTDPANETWDTFAGAGTAGEQAFRTVDSLTSPATASKFYNAWIALNYDAAALTYDFLHHGILADDPDEPNDDFATATPVASIGFLKEHRILNLFNEDWYQFTLTQAVPSVIASVVFDRGKFASAVVALELRSAGDTVIAVGNSVDPSSPIKLTTAALPAGVYRLRIALTSGVPVSDYLVQAFTPLTFTSAAFQPWTVGKQYDVPLTISGGIPPYVLTVPTNSVAPTGLVLDGTNARVTGIPTGPAGGVPQYGSYSYAFGLIALDSARPPNQVQGQQTFTLNDVVRSRFSEFVVFAKDMPVDRAWPPVGGTAPFSVVVDDGALPSGVAAAGGASLRFVGTPDTSGFSPFKITATDVSGSTATTLSAGVVCVPVGPLELAAGKTAGGFWFDAVKDASVGFTITTAKKKLVRSLRLAMYDADGFRTLPITPKYGKGKASFTKFIAPSSGRFYCVVASDDELGATTLNCVAKSKLPVSGKGDAGTFSFGGDDTLSLPVGILNGGTLTFTVKPDKTSGLRVKVAALKNPAGESVTLGATDVKVVAKTGMLTLTHKVDVSGTWTLVLGAQDGPRGTFTYAYKLKQPKGVVYLAD
jgi:hypothetical protein